MMKREILLQTFTPKLMLVLLKKKSLVKLVFKWKKWKKKTKMMEYRSNEVYYLHFNNFVPCTVICI